MDFVSQCYQKQVKSACRLHGYRTVLGQSLSTIRFCIAYPGQRTVLRLLMTYCINKPTSLRTKKIASTPLPQKVAVPIRSYCYFHIYLLTVT